METTTGLDRRTLTLGALAVAIVPVSGCMSKPLRPVNPDGTYCFSTARYRRELTCTTEPVPSLEVEARAKRFEAVQGVFTLYVVRHRWGDAANQVAISIDGRPPIVTIPVSVVRLQLKPGEHHLALEWEGRTIERTITVAGGEVRFVELVGSVWSWGSSYRWEDASIGTTRARAASAKLVADFDWSR